MTPHKQLFPMAVNKTPAVRSSTGLFQSHTETNLHPKLPSQPVFIPRFQPDSLKYILPADHVLRAKQSSTPLAQA